MCKDQPNLFCGYVNGKLKKKKKGISKLERDSLIYEDAKQIAEIMNNCFQLVFMSESEFVEQRIDTEVIRMHSIEVSVEELKR